MSGDLPFRNQALERAWAAVARLGDADEDRIVAFTYLAKHRGSLPGAVCLAASELTYLVAWSRVEAIAEAMCACGQRRLLVPTTGRTQCLPGSQPRKAVIGRDTPLLLAPWGSDGTWPLLQFAMIQNGLEMTRFGPADPVTQRISLAEMAAWSSATSGPRVTFHNGVQLPLFVVADETLTKGTDWRITVELDAAIVQIPSSARLHVCA